MAFADWVKRSKLAVTALARYGRLRETLQAAYKAGERDGRKKAEAVAENAVKLAVMVEREQCATTCEALELVFDCQSAQPGYWPDQIAHKCAIAIRERSNADVTGLAPRKDNE